MPYSTIKLYFTIAYAQVNPSAPLTRNLKVLKLKLIVTTMSLCRYHIAALFLIKSPHETHFPVRTDQSCGPGAPEPGPVRRRERVWHPPGAGRHGRIAGLRRRFRLWRS